MQKIDYKFQRPPSMNTGIQLTSLPVTYSLVIHSLATRQSNSFPSFQDPNLSYRANSPCFTIIIVALHFHFILLLLEILTLLTKKLHIPKFELATCGL